MAPSGDDPDLAREHEGGVSLRHGAALRGRAGGADGRRFALARRLEGLSQLRLVRAWVDLRTQHVLPHGEKVRSALRVGRQREPSRRSHDRGSLLVAGCGGQLRDLKPRVDVFLMRRERRPAAL